MPRHRIVLAAFLCIFMILVATHPAAAESPPPDLNDSSMWVPWQDFKKILEQLQAGSVTPPVEPPPVDAVISKAAYRAVVGNNTVTLEVDAQVLVLKEKGWATLPILRNGLPVFGSSLDGKATALVDRGDGNLHLVVKGEGPHQLSLSIKVNLVSDKGPQHFVLPTLLAQVNQLQVVIPEPQLQVRMNGGDLLESVTSGNITSASGSFSPHQSNIEISWARKAPKTVKEEARVSAEVRTMLTLGEGQGVYTAFIDYDILHKPVSVFSMLLPAEVTVADVSTDGLVDWKVDKTEEGQRLSVSIAYEAIGKHSVAVTYEGAMPSGDSADFAVADLVVENVVHEIGYLAVAVLSNVQVRPKADSVENLTTQDPTDLPSDLRSAGDQKVLYGFKYIKHPAKLTLQVEHHKDASMLTCEVESAIHNVMITPQGKQLMEVNYKVANRSLQFMTMTLPPETDLWAAYRDGKPVKVAEKDGNILLPIFQSDRGQTVNLRVLAYRNVDSFSLMGRKAIELPMLDVGIRRADLRIYLPRKNKYKISSGKFSLGSTDTTPVDSKLDMLELSAGEDIPAKDQWDKNIAYRMQQTKGNVGQVLESSNAYNPSYDNALSRGVLPIEINVHWDGLYYGYMTRIIDPGEELGVKFCYVKKWNSEIPGWLLTFYGIFLGVLAARWLLSKKVGSIQKPRKGMWKFALICLPFVLLLGLIHNNATGALISSFILGVIFGTAGPFYKVTIQWLRDKQEARKAVPIAQKVTEAPAEKTADSDKEGDDQ